MASKCTNPCCTATRHRNEGKLFRLDLDLGSITGADEHKTEYMWLCAGCAERMHPRVEVSGNTIKVRLSLNAPIPPADARVAPPGLWVN